MRRPYGRRARGPGGRSRRTWPEVGKAATAAQAPGRLVAEVAPVVGGRGSSRTTDTRRRRTRAAANRGAWASVAMRAQRDEEGPRAPERARKLRSRAVQAAQRGVGSAPSPRRRVRFEGGLPELALPGVLVPDQVVEELVGADVEEPHLDLAVAVEAVHQSLEGDPTHSRVDADRGRGARRGAPRRRHRPRRRPDRPCPGWPAGWSGRSPSGASRRGGSRSPRRAAFISGASPRSTASVAGEARVEQASTEADVRRSPCHRVRPRDAHLRAPKLPPSDGLAVPGGCRLGLAALPPGPQHGAHESRSLLEGLRPLQSTTQSPKLGEHGQPVSRARPPTGPRDSARAGRPLRPGPADRRAWCRRQSGAALRGHHAADQMPLVR